jgi:putative intracellular protease/amidase
MYLYVLDGLADWETAQLCAEVRSRRYFAPDAPDCPIALVGADRRPVETMGGFTMQPALAVAELAMAPEDLLVLPGADTWLDPVHDPVLALAKARIGAGLPVAAICGATFGLARVGALDGRAHTSNDLGYLKAVCPAYRGEAGYRHVGAVRDGMLVTAAGTAALDFAKEALDLLGVFRPATLATWHRLFKTGEPTAFFELMASLETGAAASVGAA